MIRQKSGQCRWRSPNLAVRTFSPRPRDCLVEFAQEMRLSKPFPFRRSLNQTGGDILLKVELYSDCIHYPMLALARDIYNPSQELNWKQGECGGDIADFHYRKCLCLVPLTEIPHSILSHLWGYQY